MTLAQTNESAAFSDSPDIAFAVFDEIQNPVRCELRRQTFRDLFSLGRHVQKSKAIGRDPVMAPRIRKVHALSLFRASAPWPRAAPLLFPGGQKKEAVRGGCPYAVGRRGKNSRHTLRR